MSIRKVLTIAGSDSSGGAGIQADLKTFQERGVYGMTALTTIVAMDPDNGWAHQVFPVALETLKAQMKTIVEGIGVDAMKTGMLGSVEIIELAAETIDRYQLKNVVIDPVMVCKGTDEVLHPETAVALRDVLVPRATVVTPNLFEAWQLSGHGPIRTVEDMKAAAKKIHELGAKYVLVKGGGKLEHEKAVDVFYDGETFDILEGERIDTTYTHGAGCTYSAAITAELAKGASVSEAVRTAKVFITEAIRHGFPLNQYVGPTLHAAYRWYKEQSVQP
ncbi:pyridoxine/pyridoxal/pyridoxamine kinase [Polycladomyces subterraneus]|uniref:pyridoxal kinase n=1 Tax=Polycladomyces subterraneus TaxID=1016997 RepID=A0ABT8IPK9_9BACL|nr:pyridoxine/pyridoxal/pyridoxamine kinase [Polycladomyces subterraneus]MDN4594728.1 pyridoxine/pyridoxal/pyridoxamine kinase [Polycladomyces subterraneus]